MAALHEHGETHSHSPPQYNAAFSIAIVANGLFVLVQIVFAYMANSTSLLADAIHNFGDVLSLILAWIGNHLLKRLPTSQSTYGMKKTSILAALANGVLLVFSCGIIVTEALYKFFSPSSIEALDVMMIAAIGIIVNASTAALFLKGSDDLNIRSAFLHLFYDALISVGVVASAFLIYLTHWVWIDPLVGILIALVIIKGTWNLFSDSFRLIIDGVPRHIPLSSVQNLLESQNGVKGVHDLHVWALSTQENALSVHLWMPEEPMTDAARQQLASILEEKYHIQHVTIQVERVKGFCSDTCVPYLINY